jgi:hypothetical protein
MTDLIIDFEAGSGRQRQRATQARGEETSRGVLRLLRGLMAARPDFAPRYERAKTVVRAFRRPAFYEVSQRCNLWCEGCYYFEGERQHDTPEAADEAWETFFATEAERHVSMAYFIGAEPALHQERLLAAAKYFPHGNIGTNGTIKLDPAIPYRIGVSVWAADDATDKRLRGASVFRKALKNYAGDARAIILLTLSPWNLAGARTLAEMCRDHGLPLTFNMYSPTMTFLDRLGRGERNDDQYFRVSQPGSTPCFSDADLEQTRRTIDGLMDDFPETVVYSRSYNDWATQPGSRYEIDPETGVASHCGARIVGSMRYYTADHRASEIKCCTPDLDCSNCRMYSAGWSTKLQPSVHDVSSEAAFSDWLDMMAVVGRIFVQEPRHAAAMPAAL